MEGKQVRGSAHHFARLDEEDVHKVRYLLEQRDKVMKLMEGLTFKAIGRRVGCSANAIYHISRRNSWAHLKVGEKDE